MSVRFVVRRGVGLARGYLNRDDLTAEKFITHPFSAAPGERLYKTGDLVRWLADGSLEYLGRADDQVKVRGFRIELGEIENAITAHAAVKEAVVLARDSAAGGKQLVAYVVADGDGDSLAEALRSHLGQSLPDYMIPAAFVMLGQLPLTRNGKVDRKALPAPDMAQLQALYVAPRTDTEAMLCRLFQELLGVEQVGITDNFFHLGGHSLMAVQLVSRLRRSLGVDMPVRSLFVAPTVALLAAAMDAGAAATPFSNLVPIRVPSAKRVRPLFLVHPGEGEVGYARALAPHLDPNLPVYALAALGFLEGEAVLDGVPAMAAEYLRAVRHVQPEGPYRIAGWSAGGTIAYDMARQLDQAGEAVEYLGLIDTTSDYSGLSERLPWPLVGDTAADHAAVLLAGLPETVPSSMRQHMQALAKVRDVAAMLEVCREEGVFDADIDVVTLQRHLAVRTSIQRALLGYRPQPSAVPVTLFVANDSGHPGLAAGWAELALAGLDVVGVDGDHYSIMDEPQVRALGHALAESMMARQQQ